ncbi:hypothetical protein O3G_MSEX006218 [Manduca sexta]|uniref:Uncharacterized protein n=1 Tax=Manduca sexta TaxID=7130 RepID=A0A921Z1J1_MANSE|nr:hypothetical protein O3G_MSEX006218 [Manduca sexta]
MPAVKVFNIFGGQKPTEKPTAPPSHQGAIQRFYRTFSVGSDASPEHKGSKVTAIAACLEKRISEPVKSDVKNKNNVGDAVVKDTKRHHVYENVNIVSVDRNAIQEKLLDETKGYSSIYENITVVGKKIHSKSASRNNAEAKLNKALESFDKILSEFCASTSLITDVKCAKSEFIPPKLQKSKTCSIIESRCILKKANSDPESTIKSRNKVARNNSIDKTTSLWNLDDMKEKQLNAPLMPLTSTPNEKMNPDKYATYKISSKNSSRANCIKTEDLKKLDVKTRILKKTLSNPPSTPVPVVSKTKPVTKKVEKKVSDPKKIKTKMCTDNGSLNIKTSLESKEQPKSQLQKAKSVWEIGNESILISPILERTKSTTSIAGSPSKIPVIRSQMSQNKFSSTRALFSPTPDDLNNIDQASECAQKKKVTAQRKSMDKPEAGKQIRQKSQLNLKSDGKRQNDKSKKDASDSKKSSTSPKSSRKDYSDEINAMRAKLQQRKINNKRDLVIATPETKRNENDADEIDSALSPVKTMVKKLELKTAMESKTDQALFLSCKVIPAVHKELCVANTTFHNHLSTLVGRQVRCVESRDDSKTCSQLDKLALHKHADEKISDTHSDCSDDSGHVSNDAANDNEPTFDNVHDMSPTVTDELHPKPFETPKQFGIDLCENAKNVRPVRPARRSGRGNEVASGTRAADAPKVDEQVRDAVNISITTNYRCCLPAERTPPNRVPTCRDLDRLRWSICWRLVRLDLPDESCRAHSR